MLLTIDVLRENQESATSWKQKYHIIKTVHFKFSHTKTCTNNKIYDITWRVSQISDSQLVWGDKVCSNTIKLVM